MTNFNPNTATQQELRDWLAEQDGWINPNEPFGSERRGGVPLVSQWVRRLPNGDYEGLGYDPSQRHVPVPVHPHPPTLDGAAAALPEGMRVERVHCLTMCRWEYRLWFAASVFGAWLMVTDKDGWPVTRPDTGDRITDEYRLACLARVAQENSK